jgi:hypothetical protein
MPALGFMQQHVASVVDGSKPFTMRRPRKGGKGEPRLNSPLYLFEHWRTPNMRRFATATCVMRCTLTYTVDGILKVKHDGLDPVAPAIFAKVSTALLACQSARAAEREFALHQLAVFDGFSSWTDLWAFHAGQGLETDGTCKRRLYGFGNVKPEPGTDIPLPLAQP